MARLLLNALFLAKPDLLVLASQKLTSFVLTALRLRFQVAFAIQSYSIEEAL
ncbi:hypothetical protein EIKCOROL_02071 [Eikenella corrodens ATCC 23834]|uniref:Uncharacterized protein n=1 Tax=Eikenella corrodens ATCC 23834 TaxID=546274 RepID=C0DXG3_EIKCO|nr:hypothetical protein EIKCOROL_02071 [Eikenella corrodens ATCC 23834]